MSFIKTYSKSGRRRRRRGNLHFWKAYYVPGPGQELYVYALSQMSLLRTPSGRFCHYLLWSIVKNKKQKNPTIFVPHPIERWNLFLQPSDLVLTIFLFRPTGIISKHRAGRGLKSACTSGLASCLAVLSHCYYYVNKHRQPSGRKRDQVGQDPSHCGHLG